MPDLFPSKIASIPDLSSIHPFFSSSNLFSQLSSLPKSIPILIWLLVLNFPFQLPLFLLTVMCLLPLSLCSRAPPCLSHWGILASVEQSLVGQRCRARFFTVRSASVL